MAIKSIKPFSELSSMSMTLQCDGEMLLTLSKSLDQSSGLDASKELVDSEFFDSSTRLLKFNILELSKQKNRLERIQRNSQSFLSRPEYSCDFISMIQVSKVSHVINSLSKMDIKASIDDSLNPKLIEKNLETTSWPIKEEIDLKDNFEILDLFEWIAITLCPDYLKSVDDSDFCKIDNLKYLSLEGPLLPLSILDTILSASSNRFILNLKSCQRIPPPFDLNLQRLKHFNSKKFDDSACTADQMSLTIFKSANQTLSFRINSTA